MTTQAPDFYIMDERQFSVVQLMENSLLFCPNTYGLEPESVSTACWRGYQAVYTVVDEQLILSALSINLSRPDNDDGTSLFPPKLNGVAAKSISVHTREWEYSSVNLALTYSGRIIIGSGIVNPRLIGGMSIEAWNYFEVFGIDFIDGKYQGKIDLSKAMEGYRKEKGDSENNEYKKRVYTPDWQRKAHDLDAFFEKHGKKEK